MTIYRLDGRREPHPLGHAPWMDSITSATTYDLDSSTSRARILEADGLLIPSGADHLQLAKHSDALTAFVTRGGRVLINGQVEIPFLTGLARWSKLDYRSIEELTPYRLAEHPLWEGVDYLDLHLRSGLPGTYVSHDELQTRGVAGFYGRGYHANLPDKATVITGIGPLRLPLDYSFRIGDGEVVVHAGRDLDKYADPQYSTGHFGENIVSWLGSHSHAAVEGVAS